MEFVKYWLSMYLFNSIYEITNSILCSFNHIFQYNNIHLVETK